MSSFEPMSGVLVRALEPDVSGRVHVAWSTDGLAHRSVWVYVDGRLWQVVCDGGAGEAWLHLDRVKGHRIELLSVETTDAFAEDSGALPAGWSAWSPAFVTAAEVGLVRDERLAVDGVVRVEVDGSGDGGHPLWDAREARGGFGGLFGAGGLGWDGGSGVGFGLGELGVYGFGFGGSAWRWRDEGLGAGGHTLAVRVEDSAGVEAGVLTPNIGASIEALPSAARGLTVSDEMVLSWS